MLAHMAGADGQVTSEEIYALRKLSEEFGLGPLNRGTVMAATTGQSELSSVLDRLSTTNLKYGLLLDLCLTGHWDGELTDDEVQEIYQLSEGLQVDKAQTEACLKLAAQLAGGSDTSESLDSLKQLGVPREALAMACGLEEGQL